MATTETIELKVRLDDQASRQLKSIDKALNSLNGRMGGLTTSSGAAAGALGGLTSKLSLAKIGFAAVGAAAVASASAVIQATRAYENTVNQLRLVTTGADDFAATIDRLTKLAIDNRTSFGATVDLFTNLSTVTEELGLNTEQVVELTSKFSKALVVAGADAQTASAVTRQFGQAMASGTVRGDEFVSISEGLGRALAIIAKESGHTIGSLRKLSQSGGLTAGVFADMLLNSNGLEDAFKRLEPTTDQLETRLGDAFGRALVKIGEITKVTGAYKILVTALTEELEEFAKPRDELAMLNEQLVDAKAALLGISPTITKVIGDGIKFDRTIDHTNHTIERFVDKIEEQTQVFQESNPAYEKQLNLIAELELKILELEEATKKNTDANKKNKDALKDQNEEIKSQAEHFAELLKHVYPYQATLDSLASDEEKLEQQIRKTVYALSLYDRAFTLGINRVGTGAEATAHYTMETGKLRDEITRLNQELTFLQNPNLKLIHDYDMLVERSQELQARIDELALSLQEGESMTDGMSFAMNTLKAELASVNEEMNKFAPMTLETLKQQVLETQKLETKNKALFELYKQQGATVEQLGEAARILNVEFIPPEQLQTFEDFVDEMDKASAKTVNLTRHQKKLFEQLQKIKKETGELTEVQQHQFDTLSKLFQEADKNAFDLAKSVEEAFDKSISGISGAMADMLLGLGNGFSSLKDIAMNTLRSIIAALIEATVRAAILKATNASAGTGVGSAILGALGGTAALPGIGLLVGAGALLGGLFANGGTVNSGRKPILVGERGPELFLPGRAGEVVSNENLTNMSGGDPVTVQFNINAIDTQTGAQFILENKRLITGVVQDAYRRRAETGPLG
tara:strand:- start:725 stop:3307 length:2583 start_codon:yes stop_codon:yes gene_type:complete